MSATRKRSNGEGSIYQYKSGFAAYVWVETADGHRKRSYVYGKTREIVHQKWVALSQRANHGHVESVHISLETYLTRWLTEIVEPNLAPLTASTYETLVRLYIKPGLGAHRLDRLRVRDVQSWLNTLARTCQCCAQGKDQTRKARGRARCCSIGRCCDSTASPRTLRDVRTVLRSALSNAMAEELVEKNVAALVKTPKVRRRRIVAWTTDEARRFLESARNDNDPLYAAYVLILVLGLRRGEVLGLFWNSVDLAGADVVIERQLQRVRRQLIVRETKTEASDSVLPLPDICVVALRRHLSEQAEHRAGAAQAWQSTEHFVFTGRFGTPVDPQTLARAFAVRCRLAGVRPLRLHDARKTCATLLVDLGVHPRIIMRILRHADLAVTMEIYANASNEQTAAALRRLGESLN